MARSLCLFVAAALAFAVLAAPAGANHVSCGAVLTQDTTLDSDLVCTGEALEIGADGVRLDLAGHTIRGPGTSSGAIAIDARWGFDDLTVANGLIRDYAIAIFVHDSQRGEISHVDTDGSLILDTVGAYLIASNAVPDGVIGGVHITSTRIVDNTALRTGVVMGSDLHVERNDVAIGINLANIERATVTRNRTGAAPGGQAIELSNAFGLTVERNVATGGEVGIFLGAVRDSILERNQVSGAVSDGIRANSSNGPVAFVRNETSNNGDDGIEVENPQPFPGASVITKSTANFNGDLGIVAGPAVVDGGGNKAKGNGNPAQCAGVSCK